MLVPPSDLINTECGVATRRGHTRLIRTDGDLCQPRSESTQIATTMVACGVLLTQLRLQQEVCPVVGMEGYLDIIEL